jgi:serine/threonine protein kinase
MKLKGDTSKYAVKCIKSSKFISVKKEQQFGYMSRLNSDYLVKYFETFTQNDDLYVVMEYYENCNFIKKYREKNLRIPKYVCFINFH